MARVLSKRVKKIKDLAESILIYLQVKHFKYVQPGHLALHFEVPIGDVRAAMHLLNIQGHIHQCDRYNWSFGGVDRGARRTYKVKQ